MSAAEAIFGQLASQETANQQHDQAASKANQGNAENLFSQIAANGGNVPQEQSPDTSGQMTNDVGNTVIVPKEGESFEDTMNRAVQHGKTLVDKGNLTAEGSKEVGEEVASSPKKVAATLVAAPAIGAAGAAALTGTGSAAEAIENEMPFIRSNPKLYAEYIAKKGLGAIPGLLKSAWDWAQENPVKAFVLYKILDESGIGPSGIKKVLHIASGAGE